MQNPDEKESAQKLFESLLEQALLNPVEFCSLVFRHAVKIEASDIHVGVFDGGVGVRFRRDGAFVNIPLMKVGKPYECGARLKVLARMRTDIHNLPQDGRFRFEYEGGNPIDIRASVIPLRTGEHFVFRLLKNYKTPPSLHDLGFSERSREILSNTMLQTQGLILITGPTGSGKTTTLYSLLNHVDRSQRSVVTIEDPIEYVIPQVRQMQVNQKLGLTFTSGLRALLRQDPDVIMIGEIRDAETAMTAASAALTGHLVISTLHTKDACGAVNRLLDMGVDKHILSATLLASISQRLVRKMCSDGEYSGRTVIHEELIMDEAMRREIIERSTITQKRISKHHGFINLQQRGNELVAQGITTREEVNRVLGTENPGIC